MQQERREQGERVPYYPRYEPSIRVVTVFFAAVLGFGLKHLLDTLKKDAPEIYTYKWLFFLVAIFIFLRFLTGSANHLWLEYQKYKRVERRRELPKFLSWLTPDVQVTFSLSWLTLFGLLGVYLCYAGTAREFFLRASILLLATFLGSVFQVLWSWFKLSSSIGQWGYFWVGANGIQLAVVWVFMQGWLPWVSGTWGRRLLAVAIVSALILFIDFIWQLKQLAKKPPQSAEENKALARREVEEIFDHTGYCYVADEIYAPNFIGHEPTFEDIQGIEGAKQFAATYREAFPDLQSTIEDMVAEGDKVVIRFRARGTHTGDTDAFGGPTDKRVEITGVTIKRFSDGKIVEAWTHFDVLGMMRQLGQIPN